MIGKTLAHYKITEKIGAGGMGEVFRAGDSKLGREVALKMLPVVFAQDAERMARFQREAQVLASLNHPNIGAIYGLEERDDSRFLVLELIEGPTLFDRLTTGRVPLREALGIALQIAEAVEFAHESGVVHRDLKPANVKVMEDGRVKVLDFGLAKAMEDPARAPESGASDPAAPPTLSPTLKSPITGALTAANMILGTAAYMSPEQARGKPIDKRADIWAFGVMLWEMLTGRRLFDGETVSDTLAAVLRKEPDWNALPADTPPPIRRLVRRCLGRNPRERLRDIGDARIAIEEVLSGSPEDEAAAPVPHAAGVRHWAIVGVGSLVAAAAFVAGWFVGQSAEEEAAVRKFVLPVPDVSAGISSGTTLAIAPDGRRIAYTSEGVLWVRELDRVEPRRLNGTEGATKPFWSPDGEWVAYGSGTKLWKVRATGGDPAAICELSKSFSAAAGGVWGSDGEIVFCDGDGPLFTVSSQGGDADTLLPMDPEFDDDFHNVAGLPGDKGFLFVVHRKEGPYDRIDVLADGVRREVIREEGQSLSRACYSPSGHLVYRREPLNTGIWAVPFSLDELRTTGRPFLAIPDGDLPHAAADGTLVYAVGAQSRNTELLIVGRSWKERTTVGQPQPREVAPAISPDGRRIAATVVGEDDDIWILDVERGTQSRLTFAPGRESAPDWSPDGQRVYYFAGETTATHMLKMKAADGTGGVVDLGPGQDPAVSRDGKYLFYNLFDVERSSWDIWYLPLGEDGRPAGDAVPFLQSDAVDFSARLSPDGRHVAYVSLETGRFEIYLKQFPGGEGKWQVTIDGGAWPRWSADGDELFFMDGLDLYAVSVRTSPSVSLGQPEVLFSRAADSGTLPLGLPDQFDVSSDGRFLIIQPSETEREEHGPEGLLVAENWFAEFRNED